MFLWNFLITNCLCLNAFADFFTVAPVITNTLHLTLILLTRSSLGHLVLQLAPLHDFLFQLSKVKVFLNLHFFGFFYVLLLLLCEFSNLLCGILEHYSLGSLWSSVRATTTLGMLVLNNPSVDGRKFSPLLGLGCMHFALYVLINGPLSSRA